MLKHLYLIIFSTFFIGFLTGVYVYFQSREPEEQVQNDIVSQTLEIVGDMYGGCESMEQCASYKISEDGTYTFLIRKRDVESKRYDDTLSQKQLGELMSLLQKVDLARIENSEFKDTCPEAFDGARYEYTIRYYNEHYTIDTCIEDVRGEPLFESLQDYFEIFRLTHIN